MAELVLLLSICLATTAILMFGLVSVAISMSNEAARHEQRADELQNALTQRQRQLGRLAARLRQIEQQLQEMRIHIVAPSHRLRLDEQGNLREE